MTDPLTDLSAEVRHSTFLQREILDALKALQQNPRRATIGDGFRIGIGLSLWSLSLSIVLVPIALLVAQR